MSFTNLNNQMKGNCDDISNFIHKILLNQHNGENNTNLFRLFDPIDFKNGYLGDNIPNASNKYNMSSPPYHIWAKENSEHFKIYGVPMLKEENKKYMYYLLFGSMPVEIQKDSTQPCDSTSSESSNTIIEKQNKHYIPNFSDLEIKQLCECLFYPSEIEVY